MVSVLHVATLNHTFCVHVNHMWHITSPESPQFLLFVVKPVFITGLLSAQLLVYLDLVKHHMFSTLLVAAVMLV